MTDKKWKLFLIGIGLLLMGFMIGYLVGNSLNTATKEDLMRLPQIGEKTAEHIIEYRESQGGFRSLEELKNIEGIGDKTYERIVPFLTL